MHPPDWARLAEAVEAARRSAPHDTFIAFVQAIGVSEKTLRRLIDKHEPVADRTLRKIERGFGWPSGTADKILAGDTLIGTEQTADGQTLELHGPPAEYWALSAAERAAVDEVIRQMGASDRPS